MTTQDISGEIHYGEFQPGELIERQNHLGVGRVLSYDRRPGRKTGAYRVEIMWPIKRRGSVETWPEWTRTGTEFMWAVTIAKCVRCGEEVPLRDDYYGWGSYHKYDDLCPACCGAVIQEARVRCHLEKCRGTA